MKQMKDYKYHIGLKVRAFPSRLQFAMAKQNIGCSRFVYNRCVAVGNELFNLRKVSIYSEPVAQRIRFLETEQCDVKEICNLAPFLNGPDIDSMALYNAVANYNKAWKNFREVPGTSIPTFHKKRPGGTYQTNAHYIKGKITGAHFKDSTHVVLPKLGTIRIKGDKEYIESVLAVVDRQGTFTVEITGSGEMYISAALASDTPFYEELPKAGSEWALDANVENFFAGSDGEKVDNPKFYHKTEAALAKQQRILSRRYEAAKKRCPEGIRLKQYLDTCKNYQEQRKKVAALHEQIARQRNDYIHCATKREIKNHDFIAAEDLVVKNMVKNHCLAKSISDVSWGVLFWQLKYKAEFYGREFMQVPPQYTTQTCFYCGYVLQGDERLTLDDREWVCPQCGTHHDRDVNSAIVILCKALALRASQQV